MSELFDHLYELVKVEMSDQKLNLSVDTLFKVVQSAMEVVEFSRLPGKERKKAVVRIVKRIVDDTEKTNELSTVRLAIENGILEQSIDLVVAASKGELIINKKLFCKCF